jgi:hypothetical protein
MPKPLTPEQLVKRTVAKVKAAKVMAQHDVEMGLLREAGLNLDRTKVADDGSREEEG